MIHDVKVLVLGTYVPVVAQVYIFVNTNYGIFFRKCKFIDIAFVRSGWVPLNDGLADVVGRSLYDWSRVATSASVTYYLGVLPTEVYPSNDSYRWAGFPLRCLYLGSV